MKEQRILTDEWKPCPFCGEPDFDLVNAHGRWVSELRGANLESTIEPWPIGEGPEAAEVQP